MATYEDAVKKYPDWAWAFNIPGVGELLRKGVDDPNFDPMPEIMQTEWYRTTQASVRQWDALKAKDPESVNAQLREKQAQIWDMQLGLGIAPDPKVTQDTAERALRLGWESNQLNDYLVSQFNNVSAQQARSTPGSVSSTMAQLREAASQYYITLSDDTAYAYAKSIMAGEHKAEDWQAVWQQQSAQQFPTIADAISKGITPKQYFAPVQSRIAAALEINEDSVNLSDPRWSKTIDYVDDKGERRPMTYNEVDRYVRQQDEWKSTRAGQQAGADMTEMLLKTFGKVA